MRDNRSMSLRFPIALMLTIVDLAGRDIAGPRQGATMTRWLALIALTLVGCAAADPINLYERVEPCYLGRVPDHHAALAVQSWAPGALPGDFVVSHYCDAEETERQLAVQRRRR